MAAKSRQASSTGTKPPRGKRRGINFACFMDLVAFNEAGDIRGAARRSGRSATIIRQHLKELNSYLSRTLVEFPAEGESKTKAAKLTSDGKHLAEVVKAQLGQILSEITNGPVKNEFRIAALQSLASGYLPVQLSNKYEKIGSPELSITVLTGNLDKCIAALEAGSADLLACYHDNTTQAHLSSLELESLPLGDEHLVAVCSKDLFQKMSPTLTKLIAKKAQKGTSGFTFPYLSYSRHTYLGPVVANHMEQLGILRFAQSHAHADMADTLKSLALCNKGVCWLPKTLADPALSDGRLVDLAKELNWPELTVKLHVVLMGRKELLVKFRLIASGL